MTKADLLYDYPLLANSTCCTFAELLHKSRLERSSKPADLMKRMCGLAMTKREHKAWFKKLSGAYRNLMLGSSAVGLCSPHKPTPANAGSNPVEGENFKRYLAPLSKML